MFKYDPKNAGEFQEKVHGNWFTYRATTNPWALANGLFQEIDVLDGVRFCNVVKTRAYIAVDEDSNGGAVLEKWVLKRHNSYTV